MFWRSIWLKSLSINLKTRHRCFLFTSSAVGLLYTLKPLHISCEKASLSNCTACTFQSDLSKTNKEEWMCKPVTNQNILNSDKTQKNQMEILCMQLQGYLCREMEKIDGKAKFSVDKWDRKSGGGGISCILSEGNVFEKAGVNISSITGSLKKNAVLQMKSRMPHIDENKEYPFSAVGISCVIHPKNPYVPTMHFNFRYFEADFGNGKKTWWFGGGTDLTPYYLNDADAHHFHAELKKACDKHNANYYPRFKKWCDDYFYIAHRDERRGVGGIFFDDLNDGEQKDIFEFIKSCMNSIAPSYLPLVIAHKDDIYGKEEREWQLIRRGRYVEFNLVYDRGTKFGLFTPEARIESILMSLPLFAKWVYCHNYKTDPRNITLIDILKNPRDWETGNIIAQIDSLTSSIKDKDSILGIKIIDGRGLTILSQGSMENVDSGLLMSIYEHCKAIDDNVQSVTLKTEVTSVSFSQKEFNNDLSGEGVLPSTLVCVHHY